MLIHHHTSQRFIYSFLLAIYILGYLRAARGEVAPLICTLMFVIKLFIYLI